MSNEEKKKAALDEMAYMMRNRLNSKPSGYIYYVTNKKIEESIEACLAESGVDLQGDQVAVKCSWNRSFQPVMATGRDNGQDPFFVYVFTRVKPKESAQKKNTSMQRLLARVSKNVPDGKRMQFALLNRPELNNALKQFVQNKNEVTWSQCTEKKRRMNICVACLDFEKVMNYIFSIEPGHKDVSFDIIDVRVEKNLEFAMYIAKKEVHDTFKNASKDMLRMLAINQRR